MSYQRMLNKEGRPSEDEIIKTIGENSSLWLEMHMYIEESYDFAPELVFYGKKYGWTIRYRKSGKTLISLFPEEGAFSILLVLGKKEADKVESIIEKLSSNVRSIFEGTDQLHDGRWLWIRVFSKEDIESAKLLLTAKRRPKKNMGG